MDEEEQYDKVCKGRFDTIDGKLDSITERLFVDNNGKCLQSKVNMHGKLIGIVLAILGAVGICLLTFFLRLKGGG